MKIVALVPLRGGSKSIPKKNIKPLAGLPMSAWALRAASESKSISEVYVSTESVEIAEVVNGLNCGVRIISRPLEYATDEATTESVMLHFMQKVEFDVLVTIQATSPLITAVDLDKAIIKFTEENFDTMLSAVRSKRFYWNDDATPINYVPKNRPRRQDFEGTYMENGAFYITKRIVLENEQCRLGGKIGIYEMDENYGMEIDEPDDWHRVERVLLNRNFV